MSWNRCNNRVMALLSEVQKKHRCAMNHYALTVSFKHVCVRGISQRVLP